MLYGPIFIRFPRDDDDRFSSRRHPDSRVNTHTHTSARTEYESSRSSNKPHWRLHRPPKSFSVRYPSVDSTLLLPIIVKSQPQLSVCVCVWVAMMATEWLSIVFSRSNLTRWLGAWFDYQNNTNYSQERIVARCRQSEWVWLRVDPFLWWRSHIDDVITWWHPSTDKSCRLLQERKITGWSGVIHSVWRENQKCGSRVG